ncbi:phage major capsid protein [Anaerotalea alkaliphila]|uniref:Phage major capsid protein n=1 Tax=Anaerotalea alkaliphila TaxID=2662126 RepID=A0A7X5KPR6_9FIRM|nr:phage major capsid protein [Anaerotalea alkaliphila]NDL68852.1 phage major capsid protein [Anaerotalea alkaliphila]
MKNLDLLRQQKNEILSRLNQALKSGDEEVFAQAFGEFTENIQEAVLAEARGLVQQADTNILTGRGVRQLTSEEGSYFQAVIDAMRSSNPKQALTDLDVVMPKTVVDATFEDLKTSHPLLDAIDFQNTSGLIEYLVNTDESELATWGTLCSEIVKELTSGFKKVNMTHNKLSAFLPICKAMLDLGPAWLDRYTRAVLGEAASLGLEEAIVNGTGKEMPIGMNRQVGSGVVVTDGVYPLKEAVVVSSLDPTTYGGLLAALAVSPNGKSRVVNEVLFICNPVDYLQKVMPATTIRSANGTYVNNVFPFPTKVIPSIEVPVGKAVIGIGKRYFMGIGTAKSGKIEYSDEYRFLEDERVYLVKLYGHGEPLDNNAFIYADISNMKPATHRVFVANDIDSPVPTYYPLYDARLAGLTIGSLELSPTFNKSTMSYTAATVNATNTITAVAMDGEATVEILVNDVAHVNGTAATWDAGENTVVVNVTSGSETETYTVVVTKSE